MTPVNLRYYKKTQLWPFRPIVDTTSTPHYGIGKYLSSLLNPLTINNYSIEDSFEAVKHIKAIPPKLLIEG